MEHVVLNTEQAMGQLDLGFGDLPSWNDPSLATRLGVQEVRAGSILNRSRIPGQDCSINPYGGCAYGCSYCYASYMGRRLGRSSEDWGRWVLVKRNLPQLLDKELRRPRNAGVSIFLSSVTDPYQGVERRYGLTRQALQLLLRHRHSGCISVLTKSPLVTRDIDLLSQLDSDVGFSLTTAHDALSRAFEGRAPPISKRLRALARLNEAGLRTWAFLGPLFPHLLETPDELEALFAAVRAAGTRRVLLAHFNLRTYVRRRLAAELEPQAPELVARYYRRPTKERKSALGALALQGARRQGLELMCERIVDHY